MELIAENKFTVTEELFREGMIVLAVAWVFLAGFTVLRGGSPVATIIETVAMVLACLYVSVGIPRSRIKKAWKDICERSGDEMERVTRFYEDRMEVLTNVDPLIVNYEDVTRTLETEHLLIIQNTGKLGVMTLLDGFTVGAKEDVLKLIEEWSR